MSQGAHGRSLAGFSLLELLVVLAIMMAMLSVIAPVLGSAARFSWQLSCMEQMRTLGRASVTFAVDHDDWLPRGPVDLGAGRWVGDPDLGSPLEIYNRRRQTAGAALFDVEGWYGQGLLYEGAYLSSGQVYYCPSVTRPGWSFQERWPRTFVGRTPSRRTIYVTLVYRGGVWSRRGEAAGPMRLQQGSGARGLFVDNPLGGAMNHPDGYNVAYLDNAVAWRETQSPLLQDGELSRIWTTLEDR
jgi:type II secretory pathway pseudopilin PulG